MNTNNKAILHLKKDIIHASFAVNLVSCLTEKGFTKSKLARRIGVSRVTVTQYTQGIRFPSLGRLKDICAALEVKASDLLGF